MEKIITVPYEVSADGQIRSIPVSYKMDTDGDMRTITCTVNPGNSLLPFWLQRKFSIKLLFTNGSYVHLFDESNIIKNLDTSIFIDKVYAGIMAKEKIREVPA
jgi:hypothetical protein